MGPNEIRVLIRPVEARDYDLGPISRTLQKTFDAFLTALQVTDRELQPKARSGNSSFLNWRSIREFGILKRKHLAKPLRRRLSSSGAAPRGSTVAITKPSFVIPG
jgi:hypothetical protein